jgi:hypothetical protein
MNTLMKSIFIALLMIGITSVESREYVNGYEIRNDFSNKLLKKIVKSNFNKVQKETLHILDSERINHAKRVQSVISKLATSTIKVMKSSTVSDNEKFYSEIESVSKLNVDILNLSIYDSDMSTYFSSNVVKAYTSLFNSGTLLVSATPNECKDFRSIPRSINSNRTILVGNYIKTYYNCLTVKADIWVDPDTSIIDSSFATALVSALIARNNLSKLSKDKIIQKLLKLYPNIFKVS